jgi:hypothetical protein
VSFETEKCYVGSTTQTLSMRKADHKRNYKRYLAGKYHYVTSYELIKLGDVEIVLLEEFPCENTEQLHKRERHYIESIKNCVNRQIPTRTQQEYVKANRDKILQAHKVYYETNKQKIKEKNKVYYHNHLDKKRQQQKNFIKNIRTKLILKE